MRSCKCLRTLITLLLFRPFQLINLIILVVGGPESEILLGFFSAVKCTIGVTLQFLIGAKQCGGMVYQA